MTTQIIAHRGASSKYPENTMIAYKQALKDGADAIELDIHLSKDMIPVVIHDETVDRTTDGYGFVKDYTVSDLKRLSAGHWKGWKYRKAEIPTLTEVLDWIQYTKLNLVIELKNNLFPYKGMEKITMDMIEKYHMLDRTIFSSFNHDSLRMIKKLNSAAETAPLYSKPIQDPVNYAKSIGASGIHPYFRIATEHLVKRIHENGLKIRPYTVNSPHFMLTLFNWGADGIITDEPAAAAKLRKVKVK
ncbi:MAG: glycerophosphodiester phosphodiesterase [Tuberibacillus sp.]